MMQNKVVINTSSFSKEELRDFEKNLKIALLLINPDSLIYELEFMFGELINQDEDTGSQQLFGKNTFLNYNEFSRNTNSIEIVNGIFINVNMTVNHASNTVNFVIESVNVLLDSTTYTIIFNNQCADFFKSDFTCINHKIVNFINGILEIKGLNISDYFTGINPVDYVIEQVLELS